MARKEIYRYYDDFDGSQLDDDQVVVVRFGYRGRNYVLDLSVENAQKVDEVLSGYAAKARVDNAGKTTVRRRPSDSATRNRNRTIRRWAQQNGHDVADRGALPHTIIEAYEAAHS